MFKTIDVMNHALDANLLRAQILSENIVNVDTPGYKRKEVAFHSLLEKEIKNTKGEEQAFEPVVYTENANYSARLDGNNIDIDREMSELAKTKLRYDALIQRATAQIGRYKYILQNIK